MLNIGYCMSDLITHKAASKTASKYLGYFCDYTASDWSYTVDLYYTVGFELPPKSLKRVIKPDLLALLW
jgi:hypothetical protein